jgi:hypothetical protein
MAHVQAPSTDEIASYPERGVIGQGGDANELSKVLLRNGHGAYLEWEKRTGALVVSGDTGWPWGREMT